MTPMTIQLIDKGEIRVRDEINPLGPDPFETQALGRAALTALAYPGRVIGCDAALAGLLRTFVPASTRLHLDPAFEAAGVAGPDGARPVGPERATVAAAPAARAAIILPALPRGTLLHPEEGALLIVMVAGLAEAEGGPRYRVSRGAAGGRTRDLSVTGLPDGFVAARAAATADYPLGVDILLVDETTGRLAGLPRHVRLAHGEE